MSAALIFGGMAQGLGKGLSDYGVSIREAKLAAIKRETDDRRIAEGQNFQLGLQDRRENFTAGENAAAREHQTGLAGMRIDATKQEGAANRETQLELADKQINARAVEGAANRATQIALAEQSASRKASTSASVQNRRDLIAMYAKSTEGRRREGETEDQHEARLADFAIQIETQSKGMSDQDLRAKALDYASRDADISGLSDAEIKQRASEFYSTMKSLGTDAPRDETASGSAAGGLGGGSKDQGTKDNPYPVTKREDVEKLPAGAWFSTPDGRLGRKS